MSLKAELETWAAAVKAYDEQDFEKSLELFSVCPMDILRLRFPIDNILKLIDNSSKILTNIGLIYATLGEHDEAVRHFRKATDYDRYLAIA